jgi:hypothetical protein
MLLAIKRDIINIGYGRCCKETFRPASETITARSDCRCLPAKSYFSFLWLVSITASLLKNKYTMNPEDTRPISRVAKVAAVRYHKNPEEDYQPNDMISDSNNRSWIKASAVWNAKCRFKNRASLIEFVAIARTLTRLDVYSDDQGVAWLSAK